MSPDSVSHWIDRLQAGDRVAAGQLWQRYFRRLVGLAREKLAGSPRRAADEEDVALSAFASFCEGAEQGRFPELTDRDGLWRLLVVITARKAGHLRRDLACEKRGGGQLLEAGQSSEGDGWLAVVLSREPDPAFAAAAADEHRRLMAALPDDELRTVALMRMQGHEVAEIAARLDYVERSIKRKLALIRELWEKELG
jgi:DNA-directed RNA polymerase specialized sigma24 family protein